LLVVHKKRRIYLSGAEISIGYIAGCMPFLKDGKKAIPSH